MGGGDSQEEDIELEGNGAQDIHDDSWIISYLQANEILVEITPKEWIHVVHRAYKQFKWKGNSLLHVWIDGCMGSILPWTMWGPCTTCSWKNGSFWDPTNI
jgi:hypothetical protein